MDWPLIAQARNAEEVAAGLRIFLDEIPAQATDITAIISELFGVSSAIRALDNASDPSEYGRAFFKIREDLRLVLSSLRYTLRAVRCMFGRSRVSRYRIVWEDLCDQFREEGPSLCTRLEWYRAFLDDLLHVLRCDIYGQLEIIRRRLDLLLDTQHQSDAHMTRLSIEPPVSPRTPRPDFTRYPNYSTYPAPPLSPRSPLSDDWEPRVRPPAPEAPLPHSPTFSNSSSRTFSSSQTSYSNLSNNDGALRHWASRIFDGRHTANLFPSPGQPTRCYGRDEPVALQRLAAENFLQVLDAIFDPPSEVRVCLYWKPADHRARILLKTRDPITSQRLHYCIPLTALKIVRSESCLQLCRAGSSEGRLVLWARLKFTVYEKMALFYCVFEAMKRQDHVLVHPALEDLFQLEEEELFGGEIQDDSYLHAFRVFKERATGCMRLEASVRRGVMKNSPIWTAFVTHDLVRPDWLRWIDTKTLRVKDLHPELTFTSRQDAVHFYEVLRPPRPR